MPSHRRPRRSHATASDALESPATTAAQTQSRTSSRLRAAAVVAAAAIADAERPPTRPTSSRLLPPTFPIRSPGTRRRLPSSRRVHPARTSTRTLNLIPQSLLQPTDWLSSHTSRFVSTGMDNLDVSVSYVIGRNRSEALPLEARFESFNSSAQNLSASSAGVSSSSQNNTPTAARTLRKSILTKASGLTPELPLPAAELKRVEDISTDAFWTVSSAKAGYGVENLLDDRLDTYWQSDGGTPHFINVQFLQRTAVSYVCLYCDLNSDESYTPAKLSIRTGNYLLDLEEQMQFELREPKGWEIIQLQNEPWGAPHRCFMLQIAILSNHQQGRDSHFRQIKILSVKEPAQSSSLSQFVPSRQHSSAEATKTVPDSVVPSTTLLGPLPASFSVNRCMLR